MDPKVISRGDALKAGLNRYFTGKPCIAGHISERFTVLGDCCRCRCIRQNERRQREQLRKARR